MFDTVAENFAKQAQACLSLGSPFTAKLLSAATPLLASDNPVMQAVASWPGDPTADALSLRLAGALHALVLTEQDDALARTYPPNRSPAEAEMTAVIAGALSRHEAFCLNWLARAPQTNEVARSAVLLLAYGHIYRRTGMPLAIREIGASAGLNLNFDRYGYKFGATNWGLGNAAVMLAPEWEGPAPKLPDNIPVSDRLGCDTDPLDPVGNKADRLALTAYCWADQETRLARLAAAIGVARGARNRVENISADTFLARELAEPRIGVCVVVSHSIVWQYLPQAVQLEINRLLVNAGARATPQAPLAHVSFELRQDGPPTVLVRYWPGGETRAIAEADPHVRRIFMLNPD
jgi:hypothetical protein